MPSSAPSMFLPLLPIFWTLLACAIYWHSLAFPWLFATYALIGLFGLQVIVSFFYTMWPSLFGSYFLESTASIADINEQIISKNKESIVVSVIVFIVGTPIIWWLKYGLSKAQNL